MEKARVTKATLGRLPRYLRLLRELPPDKTPYISATAIAKKLSLGEVLVRKDLNSVSGAGRAKVGYEISDLIESLESVLGLNDYTSAVLVGAGKLGRALFEYDGFEDYGVKIVAAFDSNEQLIRLTQSKEILPMEMFEAFCRAHHVQIGIITVSADAAQCICDLMVKSGITAIWNFAPCNLNVPAEVLIQNEKLELSLAHLSNELSNFFLEV